MSRLFGVTTDYLLKEELGEPEPDPAESDAPLRCVTMEQAADYLALRQAAFAPRHTHGKVVGTVLCILSAVPLFIAVCLNGPDLLYVGAVSAIYWLTATAAYLLWTFGPWWDAQPQDTWILWAVAGVLYGAVMALVRGIRK